MKNILILFKKEFRTYFNSPIAYIFITIFLLVMGGLFVPVFFERGQATLRNFFNLLPWFFLFFVPAVSMRLWAEERKTGTVEILFTLPISDTEAVLAKYLAGLVFLVITLGLTATYPATVAYLGSPDKGEIICGYIGAILMGAAYLAVGSFLSSLTENQIVAFILGVAITFAFFIVGNNFVLMFVPKSLGTILKFISLSTHFDSIGRGVIDSRDILYYISVIIFFLYMNIVAVGARKWK